MLNSLVSDWTTIVSRVPQGSILGPLLFSIYMNDLPKLVYQSEVALFADDIVVYCPKTDALLVQDHLNSDLASLPQWATTNGFKINISKCHAMLFARKHRKNQVSSLKFLINHESILPEKLVKYFGVYVDQDLTWSSSHVGHVRRKSLTALATIQRVSLHKVLITPHNAFTLPHLTYCCVVWHFCTKTMSANLQWVQNYVKRIMLKKPPRTSSDVYFNLLGWLTLYQHCCLNL